MGRGLALALLSFCLGFVVATWRMRLAARARGRALRDRSRTSSKAFGVSLRASERIHDSGHPCIDVEGSRGLHHDVIMVKVDGFSAAYLDVDHDGSLRLFSDFPTKLDAEPHLSTVELAIDRKHTVTGMEEGRHG